MEIRKIVFSPTGGTKALVDILAEALVDDSCIACMRCISVCPKGAKGLNPLVRKIGDEHMKDLLSSRKDNYLFL